MGRTALVGIPVAGAALAGRGSAAPSGQQPEADSSPGAVRSGQPEAQKKADGGKGAEKPLKERKPAVQLEFCAEVNSRTAKKGDVVPLKVVEDVTIEGRRFRQDGEASAIVEAVEPPGRFGKQARIDLRLDWVKDVNGERVPLHSYSTGRRFDPKAGGASLGGALLLGPIGLAGGALIKGRQVTIRRGTRIQAALLASKSEESPGR